MTIETKKQVAKIDLLKTGCFFLTLLVIILMLGFFNVSQSKSLETTPENVALKATINTCDDITERAAAHLVAVVEFQRLEIIGRKARVFKMCMQDRGYVENTKWLSVSQPVAARTAKKESISVSEALENLRRAQMKWTKVEKNKPSYWVRNAQLKNS